MASLTRHHTWNQSYVDRARIPGTPLLLMYLFHLMACKKTNLCLSADVTSSAELLSLAENCGDHICILKTHADVICDFSDHTSSSLLSISQRKHFLVFEDRKFGDIGETVQTQYTGGIFHIARWAHIVNAHIFPGPSVVTALQDVAEQTIQEYNLKVHTEISASPLSHPSDLASDPEYALSHPVDLESSVPSNCSPTTNSSDSIKCSFDEIDLRAISSNRKESIVSVSTTISTQTEYLSNTDALNQDGTELSRLERLEPPQPARALLLLAQMSSEGNFFTDSYQAECVRIACKHREFVIGFIAQHSLNQDEEDNFITMTPGVKLPPINTEGARLCEKMGDGLGQQYNSPRSVVFDKGSDVIIVGRGIIQAEDTALAAERYRNEGWTAYLNRISSCSTS